MLPGPEQVRITADVVGPDALEGAGAVVQGVGKDMDGGLVPRHHFAVHPDVVGTHGHGLGLAFRMYAERRLRPVNTARADPVGERNPVIGSTPRQQPRSAR